MIEGGLDTLDKVDAGDVDADDALEFGVKIGDDNKEGLKFAALVELLEEFEGVVELDPDKDDGPGVATAKVMVGVAVLPVFWHIDGVVGVAVEVGTDEQELAEMTQAEEEENPGVAMGMSRTTLPRGV